MDWLKRLGRRIKWAFDDVIDWIREYEKIITIVLVSVLGTGLILFLIFGVACRGYSSDPDAIKMEISSQTLKAMDYDTVVEILEEKGFTNIRSDASDPWFLVSSGDVWEISIDGQKNFFKYSKFSKDDLILIRYYR
jgi:hypothetical protein